MVLIKRWCLALIVDADDKTQVSGTNIVMLPVYQRGTNMTVVTMRDSKYDHNISLVTSQ